tara:strand:+ start:112 stop:471 length:360 start_codon:yes stop_codon:yes gene_type:complete
MEQNTANKTTKTATKKTDSTAIRFDKVFMRKISKLVDKANKKQFGRKVKPKNFLVNLLCLADDTLLEKVIQKSQEESLTSKDQDAIFLKENLGRFSGTKEEFDQKMRELMASFLSQNPA